MLKKLRKSKIYNYLKSFIRDPFLIQHKTNLLWDEFRCMSYSELLQEWESWMLRSDLKAYFSFRYKMLKFFMAHKYTEVLRCRIKLSCIEKLNDR